MPITYYPDRVQKRAASPIDLLQKARRVYSAEGGADLDEGDINYILWPGLPSWTVKLVGLNFSSSDPKTYSISKLVGRGIISGLNDKLWFRTDGAPEQEIVLDSGFYDNDSNLLTDQLKAKLDENSAFDDLGLTPFTVSFASGLFTITPAAGELMFISRNETKPAFHKDSTGGAVFGLTEDSVMGAGVVSDTDSFAFGNTFEITSAAASAETNVVLADDIPMSVDDALLISCSGDMIASYLVDYKEN